MLRFVRGVEYTDVVLSSPCALFMVYHAGKRYAFNIKQGVINDLISQFDKKSEPFNSPTLLKQTVANAVVSTVEEASKLDNVTVYTVSMDLPFAQARWCGAAGVNNVVTVSDYKDKVFSKNYGAYINELGLLTRAVFVVDENNKVTYVEYLNEITEEPNYAKALEALK